MITTHPIANYRTDLLAFLAPLEGFRQDPYFDTKGIATIGYGFNIETNNDALLFVLNQLGVFSGRSDQDIQNIRSDFRPLIQNVPNGDEVRLVNDLNAKLREYLGPQTTTLFMLDETQSTTVFNQILGDPTTGQTVIGQGIIVQGKQQRLDSILGNSVPHNSKEYEALMSLFYNSEKLVNLTSNLAKDVIAGNRAEAWYEIRYQSNADGQHTGRRIAESNLFSPYDRPDLGVQEAEAKDVLRMYTTHRTQIRSYEASHLQDFPLGGTTSIQFQLIGAQTPLIATFAQFAGAPAVTGDVLVGIDQALVRDGLTGTAQNDLILAEGGDDVVLGGGGQDILYGGNGIDVLSGGDGNDFLFGEGDIDLLFGDGGDDVIQGNEGNDRIYGGIGDDTLKGGAGNDTYYWNTGDGNDRIEDADGSDRIIADQRLLVGGVRQTGAPANTYQSLTAQGNDLLYGEDGNDTLFGNSAQDRLYGGLGDDFLAGDNDDPSVTQGDDYLEGGTGNDILNGGWGDDLLFGGDGVDLLYGDTTRAGAGRRYGQ